MCEGALSDEEYVSTLPCGLRRFYETHYEGKAGSEADACRRLVQHHAMKDAYPLLLKSLGDGEELQRWLQMAAATLIAINANLRERRTKAKVLAAELRDIAIRFNKILVEAEEVPEFWPYGLDIGELLEGAIDDRGSLVSLAPHGQETPFLDCEELKSALNHLHAGDDRYFPTLAEVINQVAIRLDTALRSDEMNTTGYPEINVAMASRKDNRLASYVRMFCKNWDRAARVGSVPSERPSHAVLRAQAIAVLDLPEQESGDLTEERIAQYLYDAKKLKKQQSQ